MAPNVTSAKTFSQTKPGAASSEWKCELSLPNSFAPNDGLQIQVESVAESKDAASEKACCRAMALLLSSNPSQVVLRQSHWKIDVNDLVRGLPIECPGQQALPLPAPRAQQALPLPTPRAQQALPLPDPRAPNKIPVLSSATATARPTCAGGSATAHSACAAGSASATPVEACFASP